MKAIVTQQLGICAAFDELGEATWLEIEQGVRTRQPLDEESITNYNLMRLAAAVPSVLVEKHTKKREGKSGADWEMWVGKPGGFIGFRIQAKLLSYDSNRYESLYSSVQTATSQVDRLIASAESAPRRLFPLYAFYNCVRPNVDCFESLGCRGRETRPLIVGWTIASAYVIRDLLASEPTKSVQRIARSMIPIRCLYCCPSTCVKLGAVDVNQNLANVVAGRVQMAWPSIGTTAEALVHEIGPVYVERLFKGESPETGWGFLPAPLRAEIVRQRELPRGVSRVLLVRDIDLASG